MRIKACLSAVAIAAISGVLSSPSAHAETQKSNQQKDSKPNVVVKVDSGDTLSKIASQHETTYVRLFNANEQISDPDVIHPGQDVRVPDPSEQLPDRPIPKDVVAAPARAAAAPAAVRAPAPATYTPAPQRAASTGGGVWDRLAQCEASGNWAANTGNGFYGGLQFTQSSWQAVGGSGLPSNASREEQISRGQMLQARQGWGAWPACSAKLGLY